MPSRLYEVLLTADAERDLEALYRYVAEYDSPIRAEQLLDRVLEVTDSLRAEPDRGTTPKELRELGLGEFRQVFFKPYRVIYRVVDVRVVVFLIADGRRDMQELLARRLLRG
jgi:toxin ParE1/3/4